MWLLCIVLHIVSMYLGAAVYMGVLGNVFIMNSLKLSVLRMSCSWMFVFITRCLIFYSFSRIVFLKLCVSKQEPVRQYCDANAWCVLCWASLPLFSRQEEERRRREEEMRRQQEEMMRRQQEGFKGNFADAVRIVHFPIASTHVRILPFPAWGFLWMLKMSVERLYTHYILLLFVDSL